MKLKLHIAELGISPRAYGERIGVKGRNTVYRYIDEDSPQIPEREVMGRIYLESRGRVGPADFYDLPTLPKMQSRRGNKTKTHTL